MNIYKIFIVFLCMLLSIGTRLFLKNVAKINNCNNERNKLIQQTTKPVNCNWLTNVESKTNNHNHQQKKYKGNRQ